MDNAEKLATLVTQDEEKQPQKNNNILISVGLHHTQTNNLNKT
jgi:hypothetical protein